MRYKFRLWHAAAAGVNALSVAGILILTGAGRAAAEAQSYNFAADRWDSSGGCRQISVYLTEDSGFTEYMAAGVRNTLLTELKNVSVVPEEGVELIPDAYSAPAGTATVRCDTMGRAEAEITAAGGDFFLFRDFDLIDGAYFTENDIMQDGAVIDRSLAWSLYGSDRVSGMNMYINGVKFYISGVIDTPSTKAERNCAGEAPRAYISYEGASRAVPANSGSDDGTASGGFDKVTVYECISPDPVENFTLNALQNYFKGQYKDSFSVVDNTGRFEPGVLAKAFRGRWRYAVNDMPMVMPWWENASRITEYRLSTLYMIRRLLFIPPVLTALLLIFLLWRFVSRNKGRAVSAVIDKIYTINYNRRTRKENNK